MLDAYQAEVLNLSELQTRRQKLSAELQQIEQERRQLAQTRHQSIHWQQVIDHAETFCQLLGHNLEQLSFEERQALAQCLISKVVVTGEAVDIHYVLPFESTSQVAPQLTKEPEGTLGHFYRMRLADFHLPDIMPPKVEAFIRGSARSRDSHSTCSLWRGQSCLPGSVPFPTLRADALSDL